VAELQEGGAVDALFNSCWDAVQIFFSDESHLLYISGAPPFPFSPIVKR
jgi:hypothetical protein